MDRLCDAIESKEMNAEYIRGYLIPKLISMGLEDIGSLHSNSIFGRTFSLIPLAVLVEQDEISQECLDSIFDFSITYVTKEIDFRGYIDVSGWAHSVAHASDLIAELLSNPRISESKRTHLLCQWGINLRDESMPAFLYEEDQRVARALFQAIKKRQLTVPMLEAFFSALIGQSSDWIQSYFTTKPLTYRFKNITGIVQSLYIMISLNTDDQIDESFSLAVEKVIREIDLGFL